MQMNIRSTIKLLRVTILLLPAHLIFAAPIDDGKVSFDVAYNSVGFAPTNREQIQLSLHIKYNSNNISFTNTVWNFGDTAKLTTNTHTLADSLSTNFDVTHVYSNSGIYRLVVKLYSSNNFVYTSTNVITVVSFPNAAISNLVVSSNEMGVSLSWNPISSPLLKHYQIKRDGFVQAVLTGTRYIDLSAHYNKNYKYTIGAIFTNLTEELNAFVTHVVKTPNEKMAVSKSLAKEGGKVGNYFCSVNIPANYFSKTETISITPLSSSPVSFSHSPSKMQTAYEISYNEVSLENKLQLTFKFPILNNQLNLEHGGGIGKEIHSNFNTLQIFKWSESIENWEYIPSIESKDYFLNGNQFYSITAETASPGIYGVSSIPHAKLPEKGLGGLKVSTTLFVPGSENFETSHVTFIVPSEEIAGITLLVFNISGELVYKTGNRNSSQITWDGSDISGNFVPNGLYVYYISLNNNFSENANGIIAVER